VYKTPLGTYKTPACNVCYSEKHIRFSWVIDYTFTSSVGTVMLCIFFIGKTELEKDYLLKTSIFKLNVNTSIDLNNDSTVPTNWFVDIENRLTYIEENGSTDINLSEYAKKTDLFSRDYNDLHNVPEIPIVDVTREYVDNKLIGKVDVVSGKQLSTNDFTDEYVNKINSALQTVPSEYITDTELDERGYLTKHQDLSSYAKKIDIPNIAEWAKQPTKPTYSANEVGADTIGSSITALNEAKSYTDTKIVNLINNAPESMDTLKEVSDALSKNQTVVDALNEAIGNKANKSELFSKDYNELTSKPTINGIEITGNITTSQLGIEDGNDGYTPQKGVDYWNTSDIEEIHTYINNQIGGVLNGSY
jgi:hypothetical protein